MISLTAISAFMTGSAISIAAGQVPTMMGISGLLNTRDATYLVIINTLKQLKHSSLDAAMGVTALAMLYIIRYACTWSAKKWPNQKKSIFFVSTLRTVFVMLLYTMISWLVNRHHRDKPLFKILKTVPKGKALSQPNHGAMLMYTRFSKCCSAKAGLKDSQATYQRGAGFSDCPSHRAHCYLKVFWTYQQLHNQPVTRACGNWCHQHPRSIPWRLSGNWILLSHSNQV